MDWIPRGKVVELQATGGSHNSLRTRLTAALLYAHIQGVGWGELNSPEQRYLRIIRSVEGTAECRGSRTY